MGTAGVFLLALGAILYWVVEIDLPYIDDDALGAIAIIAGILALIVTALARSPYGATGRSYRASSGIGPGIALIAAGALVRWALEVDLPNVDDDALGVILMMAGAVLAAVSVIVRSEQTEAAVGGAVALAAAGAFVAWAVDVDIPYVYDDALAMILVLGGAIGVVVAVLGHLRDTRARERAGVAVYDRLPR